MKDLTGGVGMAVGCMPMTPIDLPFGDGRR